ncbi:MAG: DUF3299 domain-containing protein [Burkholderiaceae bacterium]|nr:DUF3299 domain-containing protein [Burkholderiaceae bacterium]
MKIGSWICQSGAAEARRAVASALACVLLGCCASAWAQGGAGPAPAPSLSRPLGGSGESKPVAAGTFREIKWDDLVPQDWDPLKQFKNTNFSVMNDSDPRAAEMLKRMRETWDNAPTNNQMDGVAVRIPGYLVPLEDNKSGLKEFLLVPYFGACIHTPPPPANQIIHVKPQKPPKGFRSMDTVWVSGTLKTLRSDSYMGSSGYRMDAVNVEAYVEKK